VAAVLTFVLAAVAVIVVVELVSERTGFPAAAMLTAVGLVYATLPGPNLLLDPDLVLTFVIPPLIYSAALNSSLLAIRSNLRVVISLSVALVLVTGVVVGIGFELLLPGIGLMAGIALGAAVAPPDPVAALAIGRRAGLPPRLVTLVEGEGLLNDATALTLLGVAVGALSSGHFSYWMTAGRFVLSAVGGLLVGALVAYLVRMIRSRVRDPLPVNSISLATPFAAYLLGEELHVSGVLAVAVAGLIVGHETPRVTSAGSRLQAVAVWRLVDFLLEGFVFLLIGQQLVPVMRGLRAYPIETVVAASLLTVGIVLLVRPLWLVVTQSLPQALHTRLGGESAREEKRLSGREVLIMSWAGTRGVITLAAISTLPLAAQGAPFESRDLLLFCAYLVVLVTLLGQGSTFSLVVRATGLRASPAAEAVTRNEARAAAVQAGLIRLDQLAEDDDYPADVLAGLRDILARRAERYRRRLDLLESAEDGEVPESPRYDAAVRARRAVIEAQRDELLRWRDAGRLPDAGLRVLERELDHEERILPGS
jgi:CPA1 family monovalent cation:H+ antiporter